VCQVTNHVVVELAPSVLAVNHGELLSALLPKVPLDSKNRGSLTPMRPTRMVLHKIRDIVDAIMYNNPAILHRRVKLHLVHRVSHIVSPLSGGPLLGRALVHLSLGHGTGVARAHR